MSEDVLTMYREAVAELTGAGGPFALEHHVSAAGPVRMFAETPANLGDLYATIRASFADRPMIAHDDGRDSYAEVFDRAASLGAALREAHGIAAGDRVGIAMRNLPQWFAAFIAVTRIGAVAALLNSRGAADEIADAATRVGCRLILADDRCAERLSATDVGIPVLDLAATAALAAGDWRDRAPARVDRDAPAAILFTSGTTGLPKGATLTHRNLTSMATNMRYLATLGLKLAARRYGLAFETIAAAAPVPSVLMIFPLFHISGITNFLMCATAGGMMTMIRRWEPAVALDLIETNGITAVSGPSLVLADLLDQPDAARRMGSLSSVVVGGQATPVALAERIARTLPRAAQASGWGMTELTGSASSASGAVFAAFPGSCGVLTPLIDARIVDEAGDTLPPGTPGELVVRGPMVMSGYWGDDEATAAAFDDGWFRSGDVAYLDADGLLYMVDRQKDMVISAGENIYCAEVERVLSAHADVAEVAMFGVADDRLGERAIAAVARQPGSGLDEDGAKAFAARSLADYKVPSEIVFDLGPLPRNALGKIDKIALRARYLERRPAMA